MHDNVSTAVAAIEASLREAQLNCDRYHSRESHESDLESLKYYIERAFLELLVLLDKLKLTATYSMTLAKYEAAKVKGFGETDHYEGDFYPYWAGQIRMITDAVSSAHGQHETSESELRDLKAALKRAVYAICNTSVFPAPPRNELEVHARLEAILKVTYPDLKSKPSLPKPIKNFEPDTALPSAKTLIEYKFISTAADAKRVVDEILADASGYRSKDWSQLLFVIYETGRVMPEEDWQQLLKDCHLLEGYEVIVLSGVSSIAA